MHACPGKHLALNELRLTLARVINQFEIVWGKGYDEETFTSQWKEFIAAVDGPLPLRFKSRSF